MVLQGYKGINTGSIRNRFLRETYRLVELRATLASHLVSFLANLPLTNMKKRDRDRGMNLPMDLENNQSLSLCTPLPDTPTSSSLSKKKLFVQPKGGHD